VPAVWGAAKRWRGACQYLRSSLVPPPIPGGGLLQSPSLWAGSALLRRDDLISLIELFLENLGQETGGEAKALSQDALDAVTVYEWPGNVRELENALEHAVVLSKGSLIEAGALPERITKRKKEPLVAERSYKNPTLEVIERAYIMYVLQAEGGNKTRAAEVLGIDPSTLYRKLSRYEGEAV
jgi:DNA-binding NtrC family response regulator